MGKLIVFICFLAGSPLFTLLAQQELTVADFTTSNKFVERTVGRVNWMNDGKYYSALSGNKVIQYDVTTGLPLKTLVDGAALAGGIVIDDYSFSPDEKKLLLLTNRKSIYRRSFVADYYLYDLQAGSAVKLSEEPGQSYGTFSPDGSKVAFVRNNNLFYVTVSDMSETRVTNDGKFNEIINGTTDWVYEEELSFVVGFEWSPDGNKLAYYRFDEREVKEYNLQIWGGALYPVDYRYKYPKAGEKNSKVEIWVYDLPSGNRIKADTGSEEDMYIPRIRWTADPNVLSITRLNRLQNHLLLLHTNASTGVSSEVLNEKTDTYFDIETLDIKYLASGREFIFSSEKSGFRHLYLYTVQGSLVRPLTAGEWEVTDFLGCNEKAKTCYYVSTEVSPLGRHLFAVSMDGRKKQRLSAAPGTHTINMSPDFQFYIDHHSSAAQPKVATLYQVRKNSALKVLENNEKLSAQAAAYGLSPKEFFSFETGDGVTLNGFMLKPATFDSLKEYPVMIFQYSGPGSQEVEDAWAGGHFYFHQMLAQKGYIVAVIDPRGTGGRGAEFKKVTYKQLGKYELADHLEGAKYLGSLDYIDEARMGIWGWSYGGYMSSLALTKGAGVFKLGIAVSPVTNWRFYDTIYTERYLQTPQLNPDGYDQNSPATFASRLEGSFLLIHGTGDDNVHFQNSVVLEDALVRAGKQFQTFYYPDKHHGLQGAGTKLHLYTMMLEFVTENL